jgi:putative N6-adenine-specific DNA methylase
MDRLQLVATAAFGLEAVVSRELTALGYTEQTVEDGRVTFWGDDQAIARCNLWMRTADRLLVQLGKFEARDFGQLFDGVAAIPWEAWLPLDAKFPVEGKSVRSLLHGVPAVQRVVKKAIVESRKKATQRHWFEETGPEFPVEISILKDVVTVTLDTSGEGLHRRGYRKLTSAAPLRETTAAALVMLSYWRRDRPFVDPMCGSGTIAIEAALIGRNRAPGIDRNFICEHWPRLSKEVWKQAREEARDLQKGKPPLRLIASDIDPRSVELTRANARAAGVELDLQLQTMDVLELKDQREYGVIITNPPYGERLGDRESAEALYDDLADTCAGLPTWSTYVLTSHPDFERFFRRRSDRRRKLYNGRIECTYYQFHGPRPPLGSDEAGSAADAEEQLEG